jgi:2-methylisocitrate lyase-like PEP mutase family enzyme
VTKQTQAELARQFLDLHHGRKILVLPNAWDVTSARIFEDAGFPAIATTSAGIANALGYPDSQKLPRAEMLAVVRRIVESVSLPVTADMLAGYGATPEEVAATVGEVLSSGAVGMNLEDGVDGRPDALVDLNLQKDIIRAAVEASEGARVPLVLNARTDVFLHAIGPAETRLARAIERLNAYGDSGAHCLFAIGVTDKQTIAQLVRGLNGPLNVMAMNAKDAARFAAIGVETPPVAELAQLGVRRVSLGSGPMRMTLGLLVRMARQLREEGLFTLMTEGAMTYAEANQLVQARHSGS